MGPLIIAILALIVSIVVPIWKYLAGKKGRKDEKEENINVRLSTVEKVVDKLFIIYPQLKSLDKLDNPNLTEEDTKRIVSEMLEATKISEMIDARIEKKMEKKLSDFDKGVASLAGQKLEEADKQSGKLIGDPSDYMKLGNAEYYGKNYPEAIEYYKKAIELKPDDAVAWINKGVALRELDQDKKALKAFDKATKLEPDNAVAWINKGHTLNKLGRDEEANKALDKVKGWK